jgi:hypothetical protein
MNGRLLWIAGLAAMIASVGHTQTISVSCPNPNPFPFSKIRQRWAIFNDWHQRVTCVEALFSQPGYHFTMASLPPANGFAPGNPSSASLIEHGRGLQL